MFKLNDLQIELAGICNAHCSYCTWEQRTVGKQMMDTDLALRLLDEAKAMDIDLVTYHGVGESLLHPHLIEILDRGERSGLKTRLSTNCFNLSGSRAVMLAECKNLILVLAIPWVEDDAFVNKCVWNAMGYLAMHPDNQEVHVQMVCAEGAQKYYRRLVDTFLPEVVNSTNALIYLKQPRTWPNDTPNKGFINLEFKDTPHVRIDDFETPVSLAKGCTMPERFLMVLADGTCVPCCVGMDEWGLGNIKDRTLKEVWESVEMEAIRGKWRRADDSIPCGHCKKRTDCIQ